MLRAEGELLEELEGSLLAALLLALQRLLPLFNGAPRSEPRAALRTALAQVRRCSRAPELFCMNTLQKCIQCCWCGCCLFNTGC